MKRILTIVSTILAISGCNQIRTSEEEGGLIKFDVNYPTSKATETSFETGDKIGVYITGYDGDKPLSLELGGNHTNNNALSFNGTEWIAKPPIYWGNEFKKFDIYAYYPFTNPDSIKELVYEIASDQTVPETQEYLSGYEVSDFLFATSKGVTQKDGNVNLRFSHKMSKLTIQLIKGPDYEGELPTKNIEVNILNTVTTSIIDLSTGDVIKHPRALTKKIRAKHENSNRYTAIVVPQMLNYKIPLIEILCNNVAYVIESRFNFKSGIHHTINIIMNNDPEKVKIEIGGEIDGGWN